MRKTCQSAWRSLWHIVKLLVHIVKEHWHLTQMNLANLGLTLVNPSSSVFWQKLHYKKALSKSGSLWVKSGFLPTSRASTTLVVRGMHVCKLKRVFIRELSQCRKLVQYLSIPEPIKTTKSADDCICKCRYKTPLAICNMHLCRAEERSWFKSDTSRPKSVYLTYSMTRKSVDA